MHCCVFAEQGLGPLSVSDAVRFTHTSLTCVAFCSISVGIDGHPNACTDRYLKPCVQFNSCWRRKIK